MKLSNKDIKRLNLDYAVSMASGGTCLSENFSFGARLDINQLVSGKSKIWRLPALAERRQKKKIIIHDWGTKYQMHNEQYPEAKLWMFLLNEGFELYAWIEDQGGSLREIKTEAALIAALAQIHVIHSDALQKMLSKDYCLSHDECYLANFNHTLHLQSDGVIQNILGINKFSGEDLGLDVAELINKTENPRECQTLLDTLSLEPSIDILFLEEDHLITKNYLADIIELVKKYKRVRWTHEDKQDNIFYKCFQEQDFLKSIEILYIRSGCLPRAFYKNLFHSNNRFKALKISSYSREENPIEYLDNLPELPELTKLDLFNSIVSAQGLALFLSKAKQLKSLVFNTGRENILSEAFSSKLLTESLELECLTIKTPLQITTKDMQIIFQKTPKLRVFYLYTDLELQDNASISKVAMPNLEKLVLCMSIKSHSKEKLNLFNQFPNLKSLELDYKNSNQYLFNVNHKLYKLESLHLKNLVITDINEIILCTPALKTLTLMNCKWAESHNFTDDIAWPPSLKKIKLSEVSSLKSIHLIFSSLPADIKIVMELDIRKLKFEDIKKYLKGIKNVNQLVLKSHAYSKEKMEWIKEHYPLVKLILPKSKVKKNSPNRFVKNIGLDSDTASKNSSFVVPHYFYPKQKNTLPPNYYRLQVYTEYDAKKTLLEQELKKSGIPCKPSKSNESLDREYSEQYAHSDDVFLGKITFPVGSKGLMPLPSLSCDPEEILNIFTRENLDLVLYFCPKENLHYILFKTPLKKPLRLEFLLRSTPKFRRPPSLRNKLVLQPTFTPEGKLTGKGIEKLFKLNREEQIQWLYNFFQSFEQDDLEGQFSNSVNLMNAMLLQKKGVCRHRALLFKAMAFALSIPCYVITNDCHAFVEVELKNFKFQLCLGGGRGQLEHIPLKSIDPLASAGQGPSSPLASMPSSSQAPSSYRKLLEGNNPFTTWNTLKISADSVFDYYDQLHQFARDLPMGKKNILLRLDAKASESQHIMALHLAAMKQSNHQIFYVDSLDELQQEVALIRNAQFATVPSPLAQFLINAQEGDVLIVNWTNAKAEHMPLNAMFNETRTLFNQLLPPGLIIFGLIDKMQIIGDEFYSRVPNCSEWPTQLKLPKSISSTSLAASTANPDTAVLIYDRDWRSILLGKPYIDEDGEFIWSEGAITKAIAKEENLILQCAPLAQQDFQLFMQTLLLTRQVWINGELIKLPEGFMIYTLDKAIEFEHYQYRLHLKAPLPTKPFVILNHLNYESFFSMIHIDKANKVRILPGILSHLERQVMTLYVTDPMTEAQWARILIKAKELNVLLDIYVAPGVSILLPQPKLEIRLPDKQEDNLPEIKPGFKLILSSDTDFTLSEFIKEDKQTQVIPVNILTTYGDLIEQILRKPSSSSFEFISRPGVLLTAIIQSQKILLHGNISPQLAKQLESLFATPAYLHINGSKIIIDTSITLLTGKNPFAFIKEKKRQVSRDELWQATALVGSPLRRLCEQFCEETGLSSFTYTQIIAIRDYNRKKPQANPLKHLLRLRADYHELKPIAESLWKKLSAIKKTKDSKTISLGFLAGIFGSKSKVSFIDLRRKKINLALENSPYVFLVGPSGVGKSTFVQKSLLPKDKGVIFSGIDSIQAWLSSENKPAYLFIDEANLAKPGAFDIFEGVFQSKPSVLLNGQLHQVPNTCKIIFAGNFGHYKERQQHDFFERHGQVLTFKAFPDDFLCEHVLRPLFMKALKQEKFAIMVEKLIMDCYHWFNDAFPTKGPLTIRNLQMIALRFCINTSTKEVEQRAGIAFFDEVSGLLDKSERSHLKSYISNKLKLSKLKSIKRKLKMSININMQPISDYIICPSRVNPLRLLQQDFAIRQLKLDSRDMQLGTNAVIIEGVPGIGKSKLAEVFLELNDYQLADSASDLSEGNYYLKLSSVNPTELQEQLLIAFHAGVPVILDEYNTLPLEHILNHLLSGVDLDNNPAKKPGFFFIGTQNGLETPHRKSQSRAQLNRAHKISLKDYKDDELLKIAHSLGTKPEEAKQLVSDFRAAQKFSEQHHLNPKPTTRNFFAKCA